MCIYTLRHKKQSIRTCTRARERERELGIIDEGVVSPARVKRDLYQGSGRPKRETERKRENCSFLGLCSLIIRRPALNLQFNI